MKTKKEWGLFDSYDEVAFDAWCVEALKIGLISRFEYHWKTYELIPEVPYVDDRFKKKKFHARHYTPDFWVWIKWENVHNMPSIPGLILTGPKEKKKEYDEHDFYFCIDVKPGYQKEHSRTQLFRYQQSLMLKKFNIHVNEVKVDEFFKRTFVPAFCLNKNGTLPKRFAGCMRSEQFKETLQLPNCIPGADFLKKWGKKSLNQNEIVGISIDLGKCEYSKLFIDGEIEKYDSVIKTPTPTRCRCTIDLPCGSLDFSEVIE